MDVYFCGSIRGGRSRQPVYAALVSHLERGGHAVLTAHVAAPDVLSDERRYPLTEIYRRDVRWLEVCDAVVAEVTVPSLGVGYEIAYALHQAGKPVLCLCQAGTSLSVMLEGNDTPNLRVVFYHDMAQALAALDEFLNAR
ncbi:MAG: nucleoside 2-deoxyribosyltransferase [Anaerolineae bacterium]|nr:nucleoside 2-deoxyribosyltransferase [Anaerolineae bacterium]MEB2288051.1 nucleoside 2-deoxyribosyltransferase [Anaerolineae bacterium]